MMMMDAVRLSQTDTDTGCPSSRQSLVFEIPKSNFSRTCCEQCRAETEKPASDIMVVAGDLELHPMLRPVLAIRTVPDGDDVVIVSQAHKIVAADRRLFGKVGDVAFPVFDHFLFGE